MHSGTLISKDPDIHTPLAADCHGADGAGNNVIARQPPAELQHLGRRALSAHETLRPAQPEHGLLRRPPGQPQLQVGRSQLANYISCPGVMAEWPELMRLIMPQGPAV